MGREWLRTADWLDPSRVRGYLLILAAINIATLAWLIGTSSGGVDRNGFLLGTDFLSFWAASGVLQQGGSAYDTAAHIAQQREIYAGQRGFTAFFYPPPFLLICWPIAAFGYLPALAIWLVTTGAAYAFAVRAWLGRLRWYAFAAFPPVWYTITHGQTSFLLAALLGGACWLIAGKRGFLGGVLLGLAVFKPQFGLLFPLALIASRQWRALAGAGLSAVSVSLLATLAFGPQIWGEWLGVMSAAQTAMGSGVIGFAKMQSPLAAARLLGAGPDLANALQLGVTFIVAVVLVHRAWRYGFTLDLGAALLVGALLATPFVLDYDLTLLAFPLALMANRAALPWERIAVGAGFVIAAIARPLATLTSIPTTAFVLLLLFGLLIRRIDHAAR
jgi:hypothetical protein